MKHKLIILAAALVLVAASCNKSTTSSSNTNNSTGTTDGNTNSQAQSGTVEIDMTSSGFSQTEITVKSGTIIVFKNMDTKPHWPASNPHPVHTDLSGFDPLKAVAPGSSFSFTFTKVGVWGFHDHLFPSQGGHITVE